MGNGNCASYVITCVYTIKMNKMMCEIELVCQAWQLCVGSHCV
jgi:hypothetical protein